MFVEAHLNELVFVPISHLTLMSFCTQGLPGVAESTVSISGGNLLFWEKIPAKQMRGGRKWFFLALTHLRLRRSSLSRRARIIFWEGGFCDFAFGSAQNDRVGSILRRMKVFRSKKPTKRKSVAMCIDFGLMLCALVLGWCCKHWYWIDAVCSGYGFKLGKLILDWFMSLRKNKGSSLCTICRSTFFELVFFRISHPTFMSFCTQGLPGVAESTVQ